MTVEPAFLETIAVTPDPESSELLDSLRRAITRLPAGQRQVVLMHYLEETSVNEVATLLLITPKAVEARLYQARRTLRACSAALSRFVDRRVAPMPLNPVPEDQLRDALRSYRAEPGRFEAAVRERLETADRRRQDDPLACLSPFLRGAAALLPLPFFTGCRASEAAAKTVPAAGGVKLLGYLAFPAISLFVLLGATIFGIAKIHGIQRNNHPGLDDARAETDAVLLWWKRHKWPAYLVFAATLALMWIGATWLLFLLYIISFGVLLYVLSSFARLGLGNRLLIGQSCMMGLMLLGQLTVSFGRR